MVGGRQKFKQDQGLIFYVQNSGQEFHKQLMEAAMPRKVQNHQWRESCGGSDNRKSKHACIVEARESRRMRLERTLPKDHEDRIAGKGFHSLSHCNLVYKFIPLPPSNANPRCKSHCGQRVGEAREIASMANVHSEEQKRGHPRGTEGAKNRPFCHADGHLSSQEYGVGTNNSEIQRLGCTPGWHGERRFCLTCSIHRAGFVCVTNDGRESNGCQSKATRMCRTCSRLTISLHPSQNGGRFNVIEISTQTLGYVYHDTSGRNLGPTLKTQLFLLNEICTVILWQDSYGKDN